jgi:hypothetical protein
VDQSLGGAGIEYVEDAGLHALVESEGVVSAVVEYFDDVCIYQHVSKYLFGQVDCIHSFIDVHAVDIN